MRYISVSLGFLFFLGLTTSQAQQKGKDRSGFSYGGGFGVAVASGKNAMFYNGSPDKQNAIITIIGNPYYKEEIYNVLKDDIKSISYPSSMNYNPAVSLHGYLAYIIKNRNSVFGQLRYSSFNTNGVFSLELASINTDSKIEEITYYKGGIKANEARVDIELGYHIQLVNTSKIIPFIEIFGNVNTVTVKSHDMQIGSFTSSLIHATVSNQFFDQKQGGTGFGFGTTFGIEAPLKEKMFYNIGIQGTLKTIHLLDKPTITPHGELFARLLF